jgi:RHS repeat-associated protein
MTHSGYNNTLRGRNHNYGFGNKEKQDELSLGWIDIDARNYNPELGRWMNVDQKAELFYDWTPYKYGMNNPILLSDPDGNCEFCKKVLKSAVNAYKRTLSNTYEGAKQLVSSPIQTVKKAASNHFSKLSSPQGVVSLVKDAASTATAGLTDVAHDVVETALSEDSATTLGDKIGEKAANVTVEGGLLITGEFTGKVVNKAFKSITSKVDDVAVKLSDDAIEGLNKEMKELKKALDQDHAQLQKGKDQMVRESSSGHKSNTHGLVDEVTRTIPNRIKVKQERISEINELLKNN